MSNISKILIGTAGLAASLAVAAPAAAQGYPYGTNPSGGVVGAIINSVIGGGYGQYPQGNYGYNQVNERTAVSQCAAATEQRLNAGYRGQTGYGNQGYGNQGYGNPYGGAYGNQGYANNGYGQARVLGITNVERRTNGKLKVHGVATSGRGYANGYQGQGYGNPYGGAYGNQGYGNPGYGNQGYGQNAYGAQAQADLRFSCKIDMRGRVTDISVNRIQGAYRSGY